MIGAFAARAPPRTRAHLHDARRTLAAAPAIARLVSPELGWDADRQRREVDDYEALVREEFAAAGLTL